MACGELYKTVPTNDPAFAPGSPRGHASASLPLPGRIHSTPETNRFNERGRPKFPMLESRIRVWAVKAYEEQCRKIQQQHDPENALKDAGKIGFGGRCLGA